MYPSACASLQLSHRQQIQSKPVIPSLRLMISFFETHMTYAAAMLTFLHVAFNKARVSRQKSTCSQSRHVQVCPTRTTTLASPRLGCARPGHVWEISLASDVKSKENFSALKDLRAGCLAGWTNTPNPRPHTSTPPLPTTDRDTLPASRVLVSFYPFRVLVRG